MYLKSFYIRGSWSTSNDSTLRLLHGCYSSWNPRKRHSWKLQTTQQLMCLSKLCHDSWEYPASNETRRQLRKSPPTQALAGINRPWHPTKTNHLHLDSGPNPSNVPLAIIPKPNPCSARPSPKPLKSQHWSWRQGRPLGRPGVDTEWMTGWMTVVNSGLIVANSD